MLAVSGGCDAAGVVLNVNGAREGGVGIGGSGGDPALRQINPPRLRPAQLDDGNNLLRAANQTQKRFQNGLVGGGKSVGVIGDHQRIVGQQIAAAEENRASPGRILNRHQHCTAPGGKAPDKPLPGPDIDGTAPVLDEKLSALQSLRPHTVCKIRGPEQLRRAGIVHFVSGIVGPEPACGADQRQQGVESVRCLGILTDSRTAQKDTAARFHKI